MRWHSFSPPHQRFLINKMYFWFNQPISLRAQNEISFSCASSMSSTRKNASSNLAQFKLTADLTRAIFGGEAINKLSLLFTRQPSSSSDLVTWEGKSLAKTFTWSLPPFPTPLYLPDMSSQTTGQLIMQSRISFHTSLHDTTRHEIDPIFGELQLVNWAAHLRLS